MIKGIQSRVAIVLSLILTIQTVIPVFGSDLLENGSNIINSDTCVDNDLSSVDIFETENISESISNPEETDGESSLLDSKDNLLIYKTVLDEIDNKPNHTNTDKDTVNGSDGNITWEIDENGKLTVKGTGNLFFGNNTNYFESIPWYANRKNIFSAEITI